MKITRTSIVSGVTRTMDLPVTREQLTMYLNGTLIQRAMPNLSSDEREFILTGMTPEEWDEATAEEDERAHQWDEVAF